MTVTFGRRVARAALPLHLGTNGSLGPARRCNHGLQLLAHGTTRWTLNLRARLPRGRYVALVAVDTAANMEKARKRGANVAKLTR